MDRRIMKKHILYTALFDLDRFESESQLFRKVGFMLDKELDDVTIAEVERFKELLREMVEHAEKRLPL